MGILQTNLNELSKDPQTQLSQLNLMGNDIVNWSNNLPTKLLVDYTEPVSESNETTKSTSFTNLSNFTFNFTPGNPLCTVVFHLFLQGEGYIGIFINDLLVGQPVYFMNPSAQSLSFSKKYQLSSNKQKVSLQWRAFNEGSIITKLNTNSQPGINSIQISAENS